MRSLDDVLKDLEEAEKEFKEKCLQYGIEDTKKKKQNIKDHIVFNNGVFKSDIDLLSLKISQKGKELYFKNNISKNQEMVIDNLPEKGEFELEIKDNKGNTYISILNI